MLLMWDLKDGKLAKMTPRLIKKMYIVIHWSDPVDYAAVVTTTFMSLANQCFSLRNVFFFFFLHMPFQLKPPGGSSNLWNLVSVINGQDDSLLPASYSKGVMHIKHLLKFKTVRSSFCTGPGEEAQISHSLVETHT